MTLASFTGTPDATGQATDEGAVKRAKPCIALLGEFSAGKTTLINFLVGRDILPTKVTATQVPPVWLSHGDESPYYVDSDNNEHTVDLADIQSLDVSTVRYIKIYAQSEFLESFDLIDTPGISDPNIPEFHRDTALENADIIIWCTHATQAWRASENSAWGQVPQALQERSILLATRSDKLDARNRERVKRRLTHEAGSLFGDIIMFSAVDALAGKENPDASDLLEQSGGTALLATLTRLAEQESSISTPLAEAADTAVAEEPVMPRVRPMRVTRKSGSGRERISAEKAEDVRSRVLSVSESGEMAELLEKAKAAENANYSPEGEEQVSDEPQIESEPQAECDLRIESKPQFADEERVEEEPQLHESPVLVADEATDPESDDMPEHAMTSAAMDAMDPDDDLSTEISPDLSIEEGPDHGGEDIAPDPENNMESALSNLQSLFHDDNDNGEGDEIDKVLTADPELVETGGKSGAASAIWSQIVAEFEIESIPDVLGAVGQLIERMEQEGLCFADECGAGKSDLHAGGSRLTCS